MNQRLGLIIRSLALGFFAFTTSVPAHAFDLIFKNNPDAYIATDEVTLEGQTFIRFQACEKRGKTQAQCEWLVDIPKSNFAALQACEKQNLRSGLGLAVGAGTVSYGIGVLGKAAGAAFRATEKALTVGSNLSDDIFASYLLKQSFIFGGGTFGSSLSTALAYVSGDQMITHLDEAILIRKIFTDAVSENQTVMLNDLSLKLPTGHTLQNQLTFEKVRDQLRHAFRDRGTKCLMQAANARIPEFINERDLKIVNLEPSRIDSHDEIRLIQAQ